ncbi:hypothetical protein CJ030_MR8G007188 [Morella rubra]|uniref:Uncharacterized protein n=1 Tax=Morella rubra TaxID=262757 RepID=A0A6A1UWM2_9ROSI|nr:hypothetical protein CJ030_MR8G007188 [Morella rubra]
MPRHGLGKAYEEMMWADSEGVKDHFDSTTTWPPTTVVPEEVHGEIVSGGSCEGIEERPPEAAVEHGGAHGRVSSKESARCGEHFGVTTLQGGRVATEEHCGGHHRWQSNAI